MNGWLNEHPGLCQEQEIGTEIVQGLSLSSHKWNNATPLGAFVFWLPLWLWLPSFHAFLFHTDPLIKDSASRLPHPHPAQLLQWQVLQAEGYIPCSLQHFCRPLLFSVLPRKDCLPHFSLHYKRAQMTLGILRGTTLWQWQSDVVLAQWLFWECH